MTVIYYTKQLVRGLSTDDKPSLENGAEFFETDTGHYYDRRNDGWSQRTDGGGSGDMLKSTYDPNEDGVIAEAQLGLNYATHSNANDHTQNTDTDLDATFEAALKNTDNHTSGSTNKVYTGTEQTKLSGIEASAVALATVKADADIADAISKKHANVLDHDGSTQDTAIAGKLSSSAFSGLSKITVGPTEPQSPSAGDLWVDSS